LGNLRRKGYNYKNILIIGTGQSALKVSEIINAHQAWGLNVAGFLSARDDELKIDDTIQHPPILGTINSVIEVCKNTTIDEVVIALNKDDDVDVECLVREIQNLGLVVRVVVDFLALSGSNTEVSLLNNEVPLLTYCSFALNSNQLLTKRCLDIVGSLVGLTLTALLFPFIALAIKLDSPGSLFFGQPRVRENGRRFICWKFRTMNADAESQKHTLAAHNEMKGPMFKVSNDPRITKVGRFLRKSSLDELPQFWNVLRGDMSLVGTRPPTPDEVEKYQNWHRKRISIKPGITGLWQVSGRSQIENFDDVVRLDIRYIEEWSFWLDIKLLLKTLSVVVTGRGAS
jgi:exopolysaccharide biosynthesis polyprenyl glycosylphosphotransferase